MDLPLTKLLCQALGDHLDQTLSPEVAAKIVGKVMAACYPGPVNHLAIAPRIVGSYIIQTARIADCADDLAPLHKEHWDETEGHRHALELDMDYARMRDLEAQGRYALVIVRHRETGKVVGNFGTYLSLSAHTKTLIGTEDTLFISKEHRRGRLAAALMQFTEDYHYALGVRELNVDVKLVNNVGPMIEKIGFVPVGTQYTKILKE